MTFVIRIESGTFFDARSSGIPIFLTLMPAPLGGNQNYKNVFCLKSSATLACDSYGKCGIGYSFNWTWWFWRMLTWKSISILGSTQLVSNNRINIPWFTGRFVHIFYLGLIHFGFDIICVCSFGASPVCSILFKVYS